MATSPLSFWRQPQTYLLLMGTGLGYAALVLLIGPRPLTWLAGGGISAAMVGSWAAGYRGQPKDQGPSGNFLEGEAFAEQLAQFDRQIPPKAQPIWHQARTWAMESQRFAERTYGRDPLLQVELLEAMHTVLDLARQVAEALVVIDQVETPTYRQLAQQRLDASCHRLQASHAQLQQLQDQIALAGLDPSQAPGSSLPQRLQTLVLANKQILESPPSDPT
jgi:hypothetical protein